MTNLIDINLQPRTAKHSGVQSIYHPTRPSLDYFLNQAKQNREKIPKQWSILYQTQQFQFNLLFYLHTQKSSQFINVYLLNQNFQIYKIQSHFQINLIINSFLKLKNLYQPNIDPATGFIYFKFSYFDYKQWKGGGAKYRSKDILKFFNLQKLIQSAQKLSEFGLKSQDDHLTSSLFNIQKQYLQISKMVSKLTQQNDLQYKIIEKRSQERIQKLKKVETVQFVKSIKKFTSSNPLRQFHISNKRIHNFVTSLSQDYNQLLSLIKCKNGRSNFDTLLISQSTIKKLHQLMSEIIYKRQSLTKQVFKAMEAELGKITIQLSREDQKKFIQKISLLQLLPKNTEYHFLDKYFRSGINIPIILKLSLKEETLTKFLQTNKITISLQTKMRLMLQVYSAVTTLWEQNKILLFINKFEHIFVTKNLTVKLRGLQNWYRPQHHELLEQKNEVNIKLTENLLNLSKLYYKIFFDHTLIYVRPSVQNNIQSNLMKFCQYMRPLQNLRYPSIMEYSFAARRLKQFFTGLEYIFNQNIQLARKTIQQLKFKEQQPQKYVISMSLELEIQTKKQKSYSSNSEKLLNYKHTCSWLFKILQAITKQIQ